jgi:hypothetical protein
VAAKSPPSLPSFSGNWVGGDIHGLWSFSATLYRYVPQLADVVTALDKNVSGVVGTAGWRGEAASAFTTSWDRDATAARALGVLIDQEGDVTGELAYNLATIEHALESAADQVQQAGVPVGPDGQPPEACFSNPAKQQWAQAYQQFYQECMQAAQQARQQATARLDAMYTQVSPDKGGPNYDTLGKADSLADYIRGLFAVPTMSRELIEAMLPGMRAKVDAARALARENARGPDGRFGEWSEDDRDFFTAQRAELASLEEQAANAAASENWLSKALGSSVASVADESEDWSRAAKFFGDIPFASEGLAAVGAGLTIWGDRAKGESWGLSVSDGITSNTAALVAGEAAGDLGALGGAAALGVLGVGVTGAAIGGVLVGGAVGAAVAVGVGDLVHNAFQENWGADIHKYGVLGGLGHGTVDTLDHTRHDLAQMGSTIWHGVTSIF